MNWTILKSMTSLSSVLTRALRRRTLMSLSVAAVLAGSTACTVGPNYHRPSAPVPPALKELPAPNSPEAKEWKEAQPSDQAIRGKWWEIYNDSQLNALEEQVNLSNQNIIAAEAQFTPKQVETRSERETYFHTSPNINFPQAAGTRKGLGTPVASASACR